MNYQQQMATLIQQYAAEHNRELTLEYIQSLPYHLQVWSWWVSLAYYKQNNHYKSLEDAPPGLNKVSIIGESLKSYKWKDGEYKLFQVTTRDEVKSIYGVESP